MFKNGPSTNRERETLLLLREALPEYEINPHMRLANVVKGKLAYTRAMGQYELDFVVQNPVTGEVIYAIELDDSTHDTEDGRRRDANKNRWMAQAKIPLIRIRMPNEAKTIRTRLNQPVDFITHEKINCSFEKRPALKFGIIKIRILTLAVLSFVFVIFSFNAVMKIMASNLRTNASTLQQQANQQPNSHQTEAHFQQKPVTEYMGVERKVNTPPHYERVLVRGKSVRECSIGNVVNNASVACMKDHYENVWVNSNP